MISSTRDYSSKVLLFGEYSVLLGSTALAHPLSGYSGHPVNLKSNSDRYDLKGLYSYLKAMLTNSEDQFLDLMSFAQALENNWCFNSNIPVGRGLGSSGAFCAALYDQFKVDESCEINLLQKRLSEIESYFHVSSSGVDPLISYSNQSYHIGKNKELKLVSDISSKYNSLEKEGVHIYLIDSGVSRQASPFVQLFQKKIENTDYKNILINEYVAVNESCLNFFLSANKKKLIESLSQLSQLQFQLFPEMFLKEIFEKGNSILENQQGVLKLCGAGGGGFYLLFSLVGESIKSQFPNYNLIKIKDYI